jgi:hypothetical protein
MTIAISTAVYWLATGFTATSYFVIGDADTIHATMMMASLVRLGYPACLETILGVWKLFGAAPITGLSSEPEGMGLCQSSLRRCVSSSQSPVSFSLRLG